MSMAMAREFFNALGVKRAPIKKLAPPECGYIEFGRRIAGLATSDFARDPMKAMG